MTAPLVVTQKTRYRRTVALATGAALFINTACFNYQHAAPSALRPTDDIRIGLTTEGTIELRPLLGPDVRQLNGQMQEIVGDSGIVVLIDDLVTTDGSTLPWRRGRITVPFRLTASIQQRTLDRRRTRALAISAGTIFVGVIIAAIKRAGYSGSSKSGPSSGPPE